MELDEIREVHERRGATRPIVLGEKGEHTVEVGTMAALRFEVQGIIDDKPVIVVEHVTRLDDELAPEWPNGNGSYRIFIEGVPRWITGSLDALRERIARTVDKTILAQNPLWMLFQEAVPVV